jgi:nitrate reductase beta subunit
MAQQAYMRQLQMQNLMQQEMIRQLQMQQQLQNAQRMMAIQQAQQQLVSNTANLDLSETAQASKPARTIKNSNKSKKGNSNQIVSK